MTAFLTHLSFEFKTGLRNSNLLMLNYLFPLGFYILMGFVFTQVNPSFRETMLPAMVIFTMLASAILGLPSPLVEAREAGIFRSYKINGVPADSILAIPALSTAVHALIAGAVIALSAPLLFKAPVPVNWGYFIAISILAVFNFAFLGCLISVVSANSRATVLWSQLIFLPSMLLGGLMLPIEALPASVRPISALLPTAHAMQAYLGIAFQQPVVFKPMLSIAVLAASTLIAFGLSVYLFNWDSRNNSRRGHPLLALLVLVPYIVSMFL